MPELNEVGTTMRVDEKQNWWVSPSNVVYHFGTSGMSVAAATGITHPLGFFLLSCFLITKLVICPFFFWFCFIFR